MKTKGTSKKKPLVSWPTVLSCLLLSAAWGLGSGAYQRWRARTEYDRRYSKLLELPSSISPSKGYLQRLPGVVGKALCIDFYKPNADDDDKLIAWFTRHDGFSDFKSLDRHLPRPVGDWEASRGRQFLIVSRQSESGWVHITLGQRMSPAEAEKDLATYPWRSEMLEMQKHRSD